MKKVVFLVMLSTHVLFSNDTNWFSPVKNIENTSIYIDELTVTRDNVLYVINDKAVLSSKDEGKTWEQLETPIRIIDRIWALDYNNVIVYNYRDDEFYKTTNHGTDWSRINTDETIFVNFRSFCSSRIRFRNISIQRENMTTSE